MLCPLNRWCSCLIGCLIFLSQPAFALDKVTLQLKWANAYQFAGYYAAKEMSYYQDAGLDVQIKPLQPGIDVVQEVVSGRANFATGTSGLLVARQDGAPVVVLASIFQHSPYVLIARKFKENQSIHDLNGKPILLRRLADELIVYFKREGINEGEIIASSPGMDTVEQLKSGKVSAISGYISNEPFQLSLAKFPFEIYSPRSAGIDIYGDNLFTSEAEIQKHPERVARFRQASLKGWEYILSNPEKAFEIVRKYAPDLTVERLDYEVPRINALLRSDLVPVGYMNEGRWKHTVEIYQEAGALKSDFDLSGFIYEVDSKKDLKLAYSGLTIATAVVLISMAFLYYNVRLNRRLKESLELVSHLAQHDSLTNLPNRILFADRLQRAILRARRDKEVLALLFIDIDHFKAINDGYGHQEGDEVLKAFANRIKGCIRDSDSMGRIGGDEFVVLLEGLPLASGAMEVAKKIQAAVSIAISTNGTLITTTASIGVALYPEDAHTDEELMKCADLAMYEAKQSGRNQIYFYSTAITQKVKKV